MKNQNQGNRNQNNTYSMDTLTRFYQDNKSIINGIGIAAVAGAAVFSLVKWVPFSEIASKIEDTYDRQFSKKEFSNAEPQNM